MEIVSDTFKKNGHADQRPVEQVSPLNAIHNAFRSLNTSVGHLEGLFSSDLPKIKSKTDKAELASALQPYIDRLEALRRLL